ncbi:MAG TPA: hypothetical protein PLX83_06055 [bacterium]|nr:hypothetical protein [bacterium]
MRRLYPAFIAGLIVLGISRSYGCGPDFPVAYFINGNEGQILSVPRLRFYHLLLELAGAEFQNTQIRPKWQTTLQMDLQDLREALDAAGWSAEKRDDALQRYESMRKAMKTYADGSDQDSCFCFSPCEPKARFDLAPHEAFLQELPLEFALYLRGAAAYRGNDFEEAVEYWDELLALPPEQRRYRSTWAAFMLGKAWIVLDVSRAGFYFEQTRALAREGFRDSLGLSQDSLGWEGMVFFREKRYPEAMRRYFELFQARPEQAENVSSLMWCCSRIFQESSVDRMVVEDPLCRKIVAAWIMAGDHPIKHQEWMDAVAAAGVTLDPDEAGALAWISYKVGGIERARKWLSLAESQSPWGKWIQTKIWLREGKIGEAMDLLRALADTFPSCEDADLRAELGVLKLGRREYLEAMDTFARSNCWEDAAYIAERVLTVAELEGYLQKHAKDAILMNNRAGWWSNQRPVLEKLRYLLARRLARQGEWEKALKYYPEDILKTAKDYSRFLREGQNAKNSNRKRAENLIAAARRARQQGMELMGTEVEPDWTAYNGVFSRSGAMQFRIVDRHNINFPHEPAELTAVLSAGKDEKERAARHAPRPEERFHYRYIAADLMWQAAKWLPDNDPLLAQALYEGGMCIAQRDPSAADKFYKALVRRCGRLPIGQEADRRKWFPPGFEVTNPEKPVPNG